VLELLRSGVSADWGTPSWRMVGDHSNSQAWKETMTMTIVGHGNAQSIVVLGIMPDEKRSGIPVFNIRTRQFSLYNSKSVR
jgi:hypothetical protein